MLTLTTLWEALKIMMPPNQQVKENSKGDGDYSMAGCAITATIYQVATILF